ncbi:MAG: hypothetical protein L0Y55_05510 [Anaerolineales bacterium]|nr:hypothetical protein [Anaerolineales bacterium]
MAKSSFPNLPRYRAFLLRLWQEQTASPERAAIWHLSLEDPKTGQRRGFDGLESLLTFLRAEIGETSRQAPLENEERI